MRVLWMILAVFALAPGASCAQEGGSLPAGKLVREVVYNELHDHQQHGFWRYWIKRHEQKETRLDEQVETTDGPVTRMLQSDGHPPTAADQQKEQERLNILLSSPREQAEHRQKYANDEKRIGRIVALLPDAFLYEYAGEENGCVRLRFRPNPGYPAHSIEARVFHAMSGNLWIDARSKRLARLEGRIESNVDFGFGILGRLHKGGWFLLQRTQVSATDWKTEQLEIHMSGRALLFKSIDRETSEMRGGFTSVPSGMSLSQAVELLRPLPTTASVTPTSFSAGR